MLVLIKIQNLGTKNMSQEKQEILDVVRTQTANKNSKIPIFIAIFTIIILIGVGCFYYTNAEQRAKLAESKQLLNNKKYIEAYAVLKPLADSKSSEAQYQIGLLYEKGLGLPTDYKEAFNYYELSYKNGNIKALGRLANMHYCGYGIPQSYGEAYRLFKQASDNGDTFSQSQLGNMYYNGLGVNKDYNEAYKLIKEAFDKGETSAIGQLGVMYFLGHGVDINYNEAIRLYKLGSEKGDPKSQAKLGNIYLNGHYLKKDKKEAYKLIESASNMGDKEAQFLLVMERIKENIIDKNEIQNEILKLLHISLKLEYDSFSDILSSLFKNILVKKEVKELNIKIIDICKEAIKENNTNAMIVLCPFIDINERIKYLKMANDNGNPIGSYLIAGIFLDNPAIQNYKEALKYYKKSVDDGYKNALLDLATIYEKGLGVEKDLKKAFIYTKTLADIGDPKAKFLLAIYYYFGHGTEQNNKEALRLFRLSYHIWNTKKDFFDIFNKCINELGVEKTAEEKQAEEKVLCFFRQEIYTETINNTCNRKLFADTSMLIDLDKKISEIYPKPNPQCVYDFVEPHKDLRVICKYHGAHFENE